jgi:tetratricopeptide (TPR) repeat protein
MGACFKIDDVQYNDGEKLWLVNLTAAPTEVKQSLETDLLRECRETQSDMLLGELLYKSLQYTTYRKYFESLTTQTPKIQQFLAYTYDEEGEFDKAIEFFQKAFSGYVLSNRLEQAAKVAIDIGIAYSEN